MINTGAAAAVVCDAFLDDHLELVARAALAEPARPRFMIGSGGLSLGVGRALRTGLPEPADDLPVTATPASDRTMAISGSYSDRTREQIAAAVAAGWRELDLFQPGVAERAAALHGTGAPVVVHSLARDSPGPAGPARSPAGWPRSPRPASPRCRRPG